MKKRNYNNLRVFPVLKTSISLELESRDIKFEFYLNHPHILVDLLRAIIPLHILVDLLRAIVDEIT